MTWQPIIDQLALWLAWPPWKWLVLGLVVWHVMIGRANAVRWCEALGWQGVLGLLTRIGWVQQPPPPAPAAAEKPTLAFQGGTVVADGVTYASTKPRA